MDTTVMQRPQAQSGNDEPWIIEDREAGTFKIRTSVYTDPELYKLEQREIFDKVWLLVGHASEVPNPGDFLRRNIAGRELLLTRTKDGEVRAFFNACRHKGATVCRAAKGNASRFTCVYHGWTFGNDGSLIGVPGKEAYSDAFDRSQLGLIEVRLEQYRDIVFVCFSKETGSLANFLGGATEAIDLMLDAHGGKWEVLPNPYVYTMRANWKLVFENSLDAYHAMILHSGYFTDFLPNVHGVRMTKEQVMGKHKYSSLRQTGPGHAANEIKLFTAVGDPARRARLIEEFGADKAERLDEYARQMVLFPNVFIAEQFPFLRVYYPVSPSETQTITWSFVPVSDTEASRKARIGAFTSFQGPCGFATPDDIDVMATCQTNYEALPDGTYMDASRGVWRSDDAEPEDEIITQVFFREWNRRVSGA